MIAPLFLIWAMGELAKRGGGAPIATPTTAPSWPTRAHPPPSRLPSPKTAPAPVKARTRVRSQLPTAPQVPWVRRKRRSKPASKVPDAAPPMPSAATPAAVPEQEIPAAAPARRTAQQAARDLLSYVRQAIAKRQASMLGTRGRPNLFVRAAQEDMGGIAADGIYGTQTRNRGKALLGQTFPARVSGGDTLYIP